MIFYTSICANYFDKASVLAESVKRWMPGSRFVVGLVEREVPAKALEIKSVDAIVLSKDNGIPHFDQFMFKHRIVEASTAVKGALSLDLMRRYPEEDYFVYLDPDTCVFSDLRPILREFLEKAPIGLTPHLLSAGNLDMEISCLKHGVYNLGFLALKRSEESLKFLNWWNDRLLRFCYEDFNAGLFTDQKWINLAPVFFKTTAIDHPGFNFATWNFMERQLSHDGSRFLVDGKPLMFVHFSGYDSKTFIWAADQWGSESNKNFARQLSAIYDEARAPYLHFKSIPWSYSTYTNGSKIQDEERVEFRKSHQKSAQSLDPFVRS